MFAWLVSLLPASWIRAAGRLQFKLPVLGAVFVLFAREVLASKGVIRYAVGKGLRFDATGGQPGYLFGTAEPEEQTALAKYLRLRDVFYDIGANVGFFAT